MNEWTATEKLVNLIFNLRIERKTRQRKYVEARAVFYKIMRNFYGKTYISIGAHLGKNHATVIHGLMNLDSWMKYDSGLLEKYDFAIQKLEEGPGPQEEVLMSELITENKFLKMELERLTLQVKIADAKLNKNENTVVRINQILNEVSF